MDMVKVIEGLEKVSRYFKSMLKVGYDGDADIYRGHRESVKMALEMLKEQGNTINELQHAYEYLQKQFFEVQDKLLNEQEAVEPRRDANCVRMFRCGVCGEYVGFIDSDPGDPNEQDNYCRNCGQAVKWNV